MSNLVKQCMSDIERGIQIEFLGRDDWLQHYEKVLITLPPVEYDFDTYNEALNLMKHEKKLAYKKEALREKIKNLTQDAHNFSMAAKECAIAAEQYREELKNL